MAEALQPHNLHDILDAFNAPIKFDQAWALVYAYLTKVQDQQSWSKVQSLRDIYIYVDGSMSIVNGANSEQAPGSH